MSRSRRWAVLVLGISCAVGAALGAPAKEQDKAKEPEKPAAPSSSKPKKPIAPEDLPVVITNDDLNRLVGPEPTTEDAKPEGNEEGKGKVAAQEPAAKPDADPLQALEEEKQRAAERDVKRAEAEKAAADADARVKELEQRVLATKNFLRPRPVLSKEETEATKDMSAPQRLDRAQQQLDEARKEAEKAKAELERARSGS